MLINILGGKCKKCGLTDLLEFDHINPKTKVKTITALISYRIDTLLKELEKCQLLCKNCHNEKTRDELGRVSHGTIGMYRHYRCRCNKCKKVWNKATRKWKRHSALV